MVDIRHGKFGFNSGYAHCLKLKVCHGTGGILCECLVDAKADFPTGGHLAIHEVGSNNFLCNAFSHKYSLVYLLILLLFIVSVL
ncbi:hypothetical protein SDC9_185923 [bioreactor metagenome]|uniref:Uncharacterized protein n=1 Tax=bioreactor metagenome TaxID=1076179 RepID=A0A645HJN0_9ZZZZ